MYLEGLPHKPYFIAFTLQEQIIIGPIKKMVALYVVGVMKCFEHGQFLFLLFSDFIGILFFFSF